MPHQVPDPAGHRLEKRPVSSSPTRWVAAAWRARSSLSGERDLIGSRGWQQVWQSAIVNRAKRPERRHLRAAAHPTRRDGVIAMALLVLPWVVALAQVHRHRHLDGGTIGILVAVSLGMPTLWVTWAAYRGPRRASFQASSLSLVQVADQLAVVVGAQWSAEAAIRRLNDPYPLPVSWDPADASLTDSWDSLVKLATRGAGQPSPAPGETWATGPYDLAGMGGELAGLLARVPTARLVVLGEPGAGKTMLMVRLVLDLLARRPKGSPVPILASIASWNPADQGLWDWMAAQLLIDHPTLASRPAEDRPEPSRAAALLASGLILPILDGLDEIPEQVRGPAISRINDAMRPGQQLVVTCRTQQYRDAVRPQSDLEVTLRASAAIQVRPLDAAAVRDYLSDDAAGPAARARWEPVFALFGTQAPAARALSTPLMVGLARAIYNPRPGELAGTLRDPAELCNPALPDQKAVESLLFDAFIPAAYRHNPDIRWKRRDAERWLVFFALHLKRSHAGPNLAWWELLTAQGVGLWLILLGGATIATSTAAATWILVVAATGGAAITAVGTATGVGLIAGAFAAGLAVTSTRVANYMASKPGLGVPIAGRYRVIGCGLGLILGAVVGVTVGIVAGALAGAETAIVVAVMISMVIGSTTLTGRTLDISEAASPLSLVSSARRQTFTRGALAWLGLSATLAVLTTSLAPGLSLQQPWDEVAAVTTAGFMFAVGLNITRAWPTYEVARMWLAFRRRLPRSLMDFLADAHKRGVLRQAGAVYQFRHIELQHRLANRSEDKELSANQPHPPQ